jgi:hypothetical protein
MDASYNDPEFSRRTTSKGTLWNPDSESAQKGNNPSYGRRRIPARSGYPAPGGGEGDRTTTPGSLPAPAYGLPRQDTTSIMIKQPETNPISHEQLVTDQSLLRTARTTSAEL